MKWKVARFVWAIEQKRYQQEGARLGVIKAALMG
jgi:hypothetical protein